ncbi:MAG: ATP-binding protein [Firmicutes bacterium]|nr:ATP-binding protein [Bacillota bacterium]
MKHFSEIKLEKGNIVKESEKVYQCPVCKDQGVYFKDDMAYICRCSKKKMTDVRRDKAGITPHLAKQTFASFDPSFYFDEKSADANMTYKERAIGILNAAKGFVDEIAKGNNPTGLLFLGGVGSGKTFLAAACANALVDQGDEVKFIVVPDFLDEIRDSFQQSSEVKEGDLMQEVKNVPILILDDLGAHNYTDWSIKTLFAILNYRVNYEKPTIVTTNLERQQIEELLGSRVHSRLVEACKFYRLENAKDIRMEKRIREIRKG